MQYTSTDGQLHHELTKSELDELIKNHNEEKEKKIESANAKKVNDTID